MNKATYNREHYLSVDLKVDQIELGFKNMEMAIVLCVSVRNIEDWRSGTPIKKNIQRQIETLLLLKREHPKIFKKIISTFE